MCTFKYILIYRNACSIEVGYEVIITGGGKFGEEITSAKVSVYNVDGWVQDLPSLNMARFYHGCGFYINDDNKKVCNLGKR